jgi:hypothetical protein
MRARSSAHYFKQGRPNFVFVGISHVTNGAFLEYGFSGLGITGLLGAGSSNRQNRRQHTYQNSRITHGISSFSPRVPWTKTGANFPCIGATIF